MKSEDKFRKRRQMTFRGLGERYRIYNPFRKGGGGFRSQTPKGSQTLFRGLWKGKLVIVYIHVGI